jgi:hypothetical protein
VTDPFGDMNGAAGAAINNHPNTGRARVSLGTSVHVRYEFCHHCRVTISKMRRECGGVKIIMRFAANFLLQIGHCESFCANPVPARKRIP